jgi:uncharacterized protein
MRRLLPIAAVGAAALVAVAFTRAGTTPSGRTVTTAGHGVVSVVPDQATISAGVRTTAPTASAALAQNAAALGKVIVALKQVGFKTLQTQQVSLVPQTSPRGRVTGYVAQNTVAVTAAIADAGRLIDAAVGAGANTVDGPALGVSVQRSLYRQALQKAVVDARAKAAALAKAGGFGLGRVVTVSEQSVQTPVVFGAAAGAKAPETPVEAGTQDVTADVQASFAIR